MVLNEAKQEVIRIYFDGAARGNPGLGGAGGIIKDDQGQILARICEFIGNLTNNQAEYKALIICLLKVSEFNPSEVKIYSDSELLTNQLKRKYKVKNKSLQPLYQEVISLLNNFQAYKIEYISREKNKEADKLANQAIDQYLNGEKEEFTISERQQKINFLD